MDGEKSQSVPKFASFRPKAPPAAPLSASTETPGLPHGRSGRVSQAQSSARKEPRGDGDSTRRRRRSANRDEFKYSSEDRSPKLRGDDTDDSRLSKHRHRDHDTHKDERRQRGRHREREERTNHGRSSPSRSSDLVTAIAPKPLAVTWDEDVELFTVDRKGDVANLTYGGLHRYSIPPYRRIGYGSVLGLSAHYRIDRTLTTDKAIVIADGRSKVTRERYLLAKPGRQEQRALRLVIPSKQEDEALHLAQFVPLQSSRKRKRGSETPGSPGNEVDYRSIEGKAKPDRRPHPDSDLEYASDSSGAGQDKLRDAELAARLRNAELSGRAKTEGSVEAWLDLIEHQEAMILTYPYTSTELSGSQQRAVAEIRISMYEEALREIGPSQAHRVRLLLGLMEESSKVQEPRKLAIQWQGILKQSAAAPGRQDTLESVDLWMKYLDFVQTTFVEFKYDTCRKAFEDCLASLAGSYDELHTSDMVTAEKLQHRQLQCRISEASLYVLLRLTTMMLEAGYHERATALWQALLEYHLFRPTELLHAKTEELLAAFEDFWESEVPRIGENAWHGWRTFYEKGGAPPEPVIIPLDIHVDPNDCFRDFVRKEEACMLALRNPGRIGDEAGEDDPYHTILFSDLKDYLAWSPATLSPLMLVQAFLKFNKLPPLPDRGQSTVQSWWLDSFLRNDHLGVHAEQAPMPYFRTTTDLLFSNPMTADMSPEWLQQVVKGLAYTVEDDFVAEYYLAFEFHNFRSGAAKAAKALLKKRPNSLRLYNSYALIEARAGNTSVSDRVFSTAITMSKTLPENARREVVLLWHAWVWEALRSSDISAAMQRMLSIVDARPIAPAADPVKEAGAVSIAPASLLKIKTTLSEGRDAYLPDPHHHYLGVLYADLLALLAYLTHSGQGCTDLPAALELYQSSLASLTYATATSAAIETLHQHRTNLLLFHVTNSKAYHPSIIRSALSESIDFCPNNTIFLEAFATTEARFRLDDRVRAALSPILTSKDSTVVSWAFAIANEMQRPVHLGSTVHSVRRLFERAVASRAGRNSAALWGWWVRWEAGTAGDLMRGKEVFLRGLTRLPWCKAFVMLAFKLLRDIMSFEELRRVYDVMVEKELRVHVDLEECFQRRGEVARR
ncbi:hypothetical protein H2201_005326 [Coniosporium apollinis]|uniref:DUF1740-domain-containing protein n=1 Tax=Coniosporium apollinis TaxID=61459 RepID=A0ABQ9NWP5_9PEZI|nr:hypothetical protein H2201_005326 [Coniosporium apollinis]